MEGGRNGKAVEERDSEWKKGGVNLVSAEGCG